MPSSHSLSPRRPLPAVVLIAALFLGGPRLARAEPPAAQVEAEAEYVHRPQVAQAFVFVLDPATPAAGTFSLGYAFGLSSGGEADRPLPINLASATGSHTFSLAYGATQGLAPFLHATIADLGSAGTATSHLAAGMAWQITRPGAPFRAAVTAAAIRESASGAMGVQLIGATSLDQGPLRLAANLRADKLFQANRDKLDTFLMAGASLKVAGPVRAGVEYVGQDLEGMVSADAEGGARHAVGPSSSADLDGGRYQLAVGAGFGLGAGSPASIVRGTFAFGF
jgi:hypothetical protein